MGNVIKSAALRVYSPEAGSSDDPVPGFVRDFGMLGQGRGEGDRVVEWEGASLTCPTNLRLRVLESTVAFANSFRGMGVGLIPEEAARSAAAELKHYHRDHPGHRSHILTSAWHVPVRWFSAFIPAEREVYESEGQVGVRFRTGLGSALARVARARDLLARLDNFQAPAEELGQLLDWLGQFEAGSMLELDYDGVASLFASSDLVVDDTCELVNESLEALESGDMLRAGECYGRVIARWAHAFSLSFSS